MRHHYTLDYYITLEDSDEKLLDAYHEPFDLDVWENLQDIFEYKFYKEYDKPYNELSWYLEPNAKDLYKELEQLWMSNKLDTSKFYIYDEEFKEFIKEKYDISDKIERKVREEIRNYYDDKEDVVLYRITNDDLDIDIYGEVMLY